MATETYKRSFIVCPYCCYAHTDMGDYPWSPEFDKDEDYTDIDCDACGKQFEVTLGIEYTFSTRQKEERKMAWQVHERKKPSALRQCAVTVSKSGLYLSDKVAEILDSDYERVVVFTDEKLHKLGLWFFKSANIPKEYARNTYMLKRTKKGGFAVSCSTLVRDNPWLSPFLTVDNRRGYFPLAQGGLEEGADLYVVDLDQPLF